MSDEYDYIRQNDDIKELARDLNHMKQQIQYLESLLGQRIQIVDTRSSRDTPAEARATGGNFDQDLNTTDSVDFVDVQLSEFLDLAENATPGTPAVDNIRLYSKDEAGFTVLERVDSAGNTIELARDGLHVVRNETGGVLSKGTVVTISGSTGNYPKIVKFDASAKDAAYVFGVVYADISDNSFGLVLEHGDLGTIDTQSFTEGSQLYADPTTPGGLTQSKPTGRDMIHPVAEVIKSNVSGILEINIGDAINLDFRALHYSTFLEQIDLSVSSDGVTITASLDNENGDSYLQAYFSNGKTTITTLPLTASLTAGTDTAPQVNYIYILASSPSTLSVSTSGWPIADHIRVAQVSVLSASTTQSDGGPFTNQVWNDEPSFEITNGRGHLAHIGEHLRSRGANYESGIDPAGSTSGYITITNPGGGDEVYFETGAGEVYQMHIQSWPAFDSALSADDIFVKNDFTTAYKRISDLRAGITADSTGTTIPNNRYFSLVFWGVVNEDSNNNWVAVNLPAGVYQSANAARADRDKHDDYSIPQQFKGVGFLICRITFQLTSTTWSVQSTDDLRGNRPSIAQGSFGVSQLTEFLDSNFRIQDNADPSKQIAFQASGITTATTRTITMPDNDVDLNDLNNYVLGESSSYTYTIPSPRCVLNMGANASSIDSNMSATFYTSTGQIWMYFEMTVPEWLQKFASDNSLTITLTTVDVLWWAASNYLSSYIDRVIIYHSDWSATNPTSKLDDSTNQFASNNNVLMTDTFNFTDFAINPADGDMGVVRIQVNNFAANDVRIAAIKPTFTLA